MTLDAAELELAITASLIDRFSEFSDDDNPLHMDQGFATAHSFKDRVAHGAISVAAISRLIGTQLPGTGALWRSLQIDWLAPLYPGDVLRLRVAVAQVSSVAGSIRLNITGTTGRDVEVLRGSAAVGIQATTQGLSTTPAAAPPAVPHSLPTAGRADRPVLVTGGTRGIGRATAIKLARLGHPVAITYHSGLAAADAVVLQIRKDGGQAHAYAFDATRPETAASLVADVRRQFGRLLALVHSASPQLSYAPFEALTQEGLSSLQTVYVGTGLALAQALAADCQAASWGRLVYVGTTAIVGDPPSNAAAYVAAKMGLLGLVRGLAVELGKRGTTCNMVSPGLTDTDLVADLPQRAKLLEAQRAPMRRLAVPDDTAALIGFLLGDEAGFITGSHLPVNGGIGML